MKRNNDIMKCMALSAILAMGMTPEASAYTFDANTRYSRLVIESRLNDFYGNKKLMGFDIFDAEGNQVKEHAGGTNLKFDYVPGLVAKAVIEAVRYYKDESWARPWFYSVESYALNNQSGLSSSPTTLDDINAAKMYCTLYDLTCAGAPYAGATMTVSGKKVDTNAKVAEAMQTAVKGITYYNKTYSIQASTLADAAGGWFHKGTSYPYQMWCDGQYMGPALLAQLENYGYTITGDASKDWDIITKQFTITWKYLWDADKELLYHAFSAVPTDSRSSCWADSKTYHSQEYWGRAEGWYFLALVDILEEMQKAGMTETANYATLRGYLNSIAAGLAKRQDAESGCWYQLLAHGADFSVSSYQSVKKEASNYLESSATAIFIAAYLKGQRLGLYDTDYSEVAKRAYKGFVENFIVDDGTGNGTVQVVRCCKSAGLGGSDKRDGSAAYYLLGSDVVPTSADPSSSDFYTEGKCFGAFILAATEYERAFIDGQASSVGHVDIPSRPSHDQAYNIVGQPVPSSAHGLVIVDGQKRMNR